MSRGLHVDERGISPVLGAALAVGMIITVSSAFLAVWVPSELDRRGEEYMRGVEESFREFGVTIGDLWIGENGSLDLKMGPDPLPLLPNPMAGGTLSVIPGELELRGESGRLIRIPGEDKIENFWFKILQDELEEYDWYIIARTSGNKDERIDSVFIYVNRDASGSHDYHYTPASDNDGREETFPKVHGGMESDLPGRLHKDWNYINVKVASGGPGAWVELYIVIVPACTPWEDVHLENKSDLGQVRFDWGDRSLVYESGMIILVQDNTSFIKSPPGTVTVMQMGEDNFEVHLNTIRVHEVEDLVSGTGTSTIEVSILQEYWKGKPQEKENVTIWINSSYRDAWWEYFANKVDELKAIGIDAKLREEENLPTMTINGEGRDVHFFQKVTNIRVILE